MPAAPIRRRYNLYFNVVLLAGIAVVTGGVAWVAVGARQVPELAVVAVASVAALGVALGAAPAAAVWERTAAQKGPFVEWDETRITGPGGWAIDLREEYRMWIGFNEYEVRTLRLQTMAMAVFCRLEQRSTVVTLIATEGTDKARAMGLKQCVLPDNRQPEITLWSPHLLAIIRRVQKQ